MEHLECIVIGAGAVGLAIARALSSTSEVAILEQHQGFGEETSSRNSGVIHAGIYYPPDFLKTRLCLEGNRQLYQYCQQHNIPHKACGKLVIASHADEIPALKTLESQAKSNGIDNLQWLNQSEVAAKEPNIRAVAALFSPSTGIIDSHAYLQQLCSDIISNGSHVLYRQTVTGICKTGKGFMVTINDHEQIQCNMLVNAAGLSAQAIAALITPAHCIPQRLLGKGHYFSYVTKRPFQHLVYPLPQKNNSALGIHATLDMAGNIKFGPDLEYVDSIDYRFEHDKKAAFCAAIQRYYPQLDADQLQPDFTGIRPKIQTEATPVQNNIEDFVIQDASTHGITGLVNLFGIESPGLTASLAIGEYVKQQLLH